MNLCPWLKEDGAGCQGAEEETTSANTAHVFAIAETACAKDEQRARAYPEKTGRPCLACVRQCRKHGQLR
eukprot:15472951-Alexandrium_andersonii.AAC.1